MNERPHLLIVDDDREIRSLLAQYLEKHEFRTTAVPDGKEMRRVLERSHVDLLILDLMLPGEDGLSLCRELRSRSQVPVIMLTARGEDVDRIIGLELGADDYVVKPFGISELLARCEGALRRHMRASGKDPVVRAGPLSIDLVAHIVTLQGKRLQLTRKEQQLLFALASHAGLVVTHEQLLWDIWHSDASNIQYLRILVRKLREKIEPDAARPRLIVSESGIGYRLDTATNGGAGAEAEISSDKASSDKTWA